MPAPSFIEQAIQAIESLFSSSPPSPSVTNAVAATQNVPATPPTPVAECPLKKGASGSGMNIDNATAHLDANFLPAYGQGHCAKYVRQAIEAGGVKLDPNTRPVSAKDYGPYLEANGFQEVPKKDYVPQKGDVVVYDGFPAGSVDPDTDEPAYGAHPDGHIEMYDGTNWGSDFKQDSISPGSAYTKADAGYEIYRP